MIAPRSFRSASSQPVSEHLKDFVADLESRGRSADYIRKVRSRVNSLIESCDWERLGDVTADSIISWRSSVSLAPRTLNHYLDAAQVFMGWLVSMSRIPENPLSGVQKVDTRGRETIERRAFTDDEIERLLASSGDRWPIYLIAAQTGLRYSEMRSLRWGDVKLGDAGRVSVITLRALTTKNRRADVIPLSRGAVSALRHLAQGDAEPTTAVFSGGMPSHHTVTADLERAGIAKVDGLGRRVDFHALRKTFITNLQRAGVKRRVAMALARHSDSRLTDGVYTDTHALPYAEALTQLPRIDLAKLGVEQPTDDAQIDAQRLRPDGLSLTRNGTGSAGVNGAQVFENTESWGEKACQIG
ncbi:MAG: tyrosine recombinase XerC, partial [Phycisphaerales bacterium]